MNEKEKSSTPSMPDFSHIEPAHKGWVLMIGGLVLLANTMGLLGRGINIVIIGLAVYMMAFGFVKAKLHLPLQKFMREYSSRKK